MSEYLKIKRSYYLFLVLFIGAISLLSFTVTYQSIYNTMQNNTLGMIKEDLDKRVQALKTFIDNSENLVVTLSKQSLLQEAIRTDFTSTPQRILEEEYRAFTDIHQIIMQLRFIDHDGKERVRIDKGINKGDKGKIIAPDALQDKKDRYYFQETSILKPGQTWVSEIDLNIEHGKIEYPYKPTIRVATPVYKGATFQGIIIVNLHLHDFLETLRKSQNYFIFLTDEKGEIILHKDPQYDWSKFLHKEISIRSVLPEVADKILQAEEFSNDKIYSKKLNIAEHQSRYTIIVNKIKDSVLRSNIDRSLLIAVPIFIAIVVIFGLLFSIIVIRKIKDFNKEMENTIDEQIDQIHDKDAMLIKQSRHAAMGEMLSMIAHQWRQPLTVVSAISSALQIKGVLGKVTSQEIEKSTKDIETQIQYLSQTISDFRDFFKPNKEKVTFLVDEMLQKCQALIIKNLQHNNITLTIQSPEQIKIKSFENELQQIVLNIINNARDAIVEQKIENGMISIEVSKDDAHVIISICDNGGGIPQDHIEKILEPYYSTKGKNGTGLGLYISNTIMQMHLKGSIEFFNQGNGTCFQLTLPV